MDTVTEAPKNKPLKDTERDQSSGGAVEPNVGLAQHTCSTAIMGLNRLQNNLLAQLLDSKTNTDVVAISTHVELEQAVRKAAQIGQQLLVLVDYRGTEPKKTLETLQGQAKKNSAWFQVALFNVPEETNLEDFSHWPGLTGTFLCNVDQSQLIRGVRAILDGEVWLPRKLISKYVHRARAYYKPIDDSIDKLTEREIEILRVMRTGARNVEIAESLNLSPHTVKTHVYNIFKKINASNRLQAVNWANEHIPHS